MCYLETCFFLSSGCAYTTVMMVTLFFFKYFLESIWKILKKGEM